MIKPEVIDLFRSPENSAPRILVVTDRLSFSKPEPAEDGDGFSLVRFIETIEGELAVLGQKAQVTKASQLSDSAADVEEFVFNDPNRGLTKSRYDVCFIFAVIPSGRLSDAELNAIATFMDEGGGVFATGDHENLGARTCKDIPRVRSMRKWFWDRNDPDNFNNAPSVSGVNRHSTILTGDDERYEFDDQSDRHLQRLYLNRRTAAGGWNVPNELDPVGRDLPHPIMQTKGSDGKVKGIAHIPDHPHEGECVIPSAEALQDTNEWPLEAGGSEQVIPEIVAKSMSHGGGFFAQEIGRYKYSWSSII